MSKRFFRWLPMLVSAVALNGCASESNAPEEKGSATSHELAPQTKATNAGFNGAMTWEHLSVDSDCRLSTTSAGRAGWIYTFTAGGSFRQN